MPMLVYALCAFTSCFCAGFLIRGYFGSRSTLLLLSSLCFMGLALNNILLFVDLVIGPAYDLSTVRLGVGLAGLSILLFGLLWETA